MKPKVALLDLNHTVYSLHRLPPEELKKYSQHLKDYYRTNEWKPLEFSDDWRYLFFWNDVADAVRGMQDDGIRCVTLSNTPIDIQIDLQRNHRYFSWDWMIPLEAYKLYKPRKECYQLAVDLLKVKPEECVMVSANRTFGDLEAAASLNMHTVWIDRKKEEESHPIKDFEDLRKYLATLS